MIQLIQDELPTLSVWLNSQIKRVTEASIPRSRKKCELCEYPMCDYQYLRGRQIDLHYSEMKDDEKEENRSRSVSAPPHVLKLLTDTGAFSMRRREGQRRRRGRARSNAVLVSAMSVPA